MLQVHHTTDYSVDSENTFEEQPMKVEKLSVDYQGKKAIEDISLVIDSAKITGIVGPNGAGKSTLIKGIVGLVKVKTGKVWIGDQPLQQLRSKIAYVEQRSVIDLTFPITVEEVVLLGTFPKLGLFRRPKKQEKQKVQESLRLVKMEKFQKRQIGELSGGQLQRIFIARALAQDAEIIFLDEPFVGIDMTSEKVIVDILKKLRNQGKTIIIVHHDLHKTKEYFDNLIILNHHLIANGPVSDVFTTSNIQKAYGESMGEIVIRGVKEA